MIERVRTVIAQHMLTFTREVPGRQTTLDCSRHKCRSALIGTNDKQMRFDKFLDILTGAKISCVVRVSCQATQPVSSIMATSFQPFFKPLSDE